MGNSEYNIAVIIELSEHKYDAVIIVVAHLWDQGVFIEKVVDDVKEVLKLGDCKDN